MAQHAILRFEIKVAVKNVGHFGAVDALRKTVLDVRAQLGEDKGC